MICMHAPKSDDLYHHAETLYQTQDDPFTRPSTGEFGPRGLFGARSVSGKG